MDVVSTKHEIKSGESDPGYDFIKINSGLNDITRPSLYGAQHYIQLRKKDGQNSSDQKMFVVVGHCCESGDLLTCKKGKPESIKEIELPSNA